MDINRKCSCSCMWKELCLVKWENHENNTTRTLALRCWHRHQGAQDKTTKYNKAWWWLFIHRVVICGRNLSICFTFGQLKCVPIPWTDAANVECKDTKRENKGYQNRNNFRLTVLTLASSLMRDTISFHFM